MTTATIGYILLGQSNMFGQAPWPLPDPIDLDLLMLDPRCLNRVLHLPGYEAPATTAYGELRPATEPIHNWLYPVPHFPVGQGGMGPAKPFGQRMREYFPHLRIVLLATARPSSIASLTVGSEVYKDTLDTALFARDVLGVTIAGILTHHGESETTDLAPALAHDGEYIRVINQLRTDLSDPDLAAVHAQLGLCGLNNIDTWNMVKAHQALVTPDRLPHSKMVKTDLTFNWHFDKLHSSTASNLAEGYAMADAMVALGHPLFAGSPYSSISPPTFAPETDTASVVCTAQAVISKVVAGSPVNASLSIGGVALAPGGEHLTNEPYPMMIRVTAARSGPGNWIAPFTVFDNLGRQTPYAIEGRTP